MMKSVVLIGSFMALTLAMGACTQPEVPPATSTQPAHQPDSSAKPATAPAGAIKYIKPGDSSPDIAKRALPAEKRTSVPADWQIVFDEARGYELALPQAAQGNVEKINNVEVFVAKLPAAAKAEVMVATYREKPLTKEELLANAKKLLVDRGATEIETGKSEKINDDYELVELNAKNREGQVTKIKLLLATDGKDNYLLFASSPEADFSTNEKMLNEILGSFAMHT